jgi:hypothetical protein
MSRDEKEDNHDIIELSREALRHPPAAAYCGECCVTTPNAPYCFVLGDSDNILFEITIIRTIDDKMLLRIWHSFYGTLQILLYPAKAYHSQTKIIKVIFDFGGRFSS